MLRYLSETHNVYTKALSPQGYLSNSHLFNYVNNAVCNIFNISLEEYKEKRDNSRLYLHDMIAGLSLITDELKEVLNKKDFDVYRLGQLRDICIRFSNEQMRHNARSKEYLALAA